MNKKLLMLVALLCALPTLSALAKSEPQNVLTLKQALKNTEQQNLQLKRYPYHQKILNALKSQAALSPNPELSFEAENFLGAHGSHAFSGAQYTLALSQLIELGDKRQNRINYATANIKAQTIEYKNTRLALLATTAERYYQVLKFQALIALNSERKNTVKQALNAIEKRAKAGAVSSADVTRMRYALSQVDLNTATLQSEFERSRLALNELWQKEQVSDYYAGDLSQISAIKSEAALLDMVNAAPEFALLQQQYMQQTANLALQKSTGQSDLTLGGGVRYNQQTDASSLVFSFSMPLQLSNANGGNIEAAQHQLTLLNEQQGQLRIQLRKQIRTLYAYYQGKAAQAQLLTHQVIPQAQTLIKQSLKSYQQGQISVLQLLDAQQALFDSKRALINTHSELYQVLLTLERLTGQPLIETHQS